MMKKKFTHLYAIMAILFILYSFSSQPPTGNTGAPGDGNCTNCHATGNFGGMVEILGLPAQIQPNTTYTITVTTSIANGTPVRAGFQMLALNGSNTNVGTLTNNSSNTGLITSGNGRVYFGHNPAQNFNGNNSISWTVDWISPAGPAGETITMYSNSILGNGGGSGGDHMVHGEAMGVLQGGGGGSVSVTITNVMDVTCLGFDDGAATAVASGGTGSYAYLWSNNATTATISNVSGDMYSVTVTDTNTGATETASVTINQPSDEVSVTITNQQNIDCNNPNGLATASGMGGTGSIQFNWSDGQTGATVNLSAGPYSVTATDANGCTSSTSGTITQNTTLPTVEAGTNMQIDCNMTSVTLQGSGSTGGAFSYNWTTADGNIVSGSTTLTPTVDMSGLYTLTITNNDNGCTNSDNVMVTGSTTPPIANAGPAMTINCNNTTATLDGTGSTSGMTYSWTTSDGNILNGANTQTPTVNAGGTYILTVTNPNNGCSSMASVSVSEDTVAPVANAGSDMELTCINAMVVLDGTGSSGNNLSYIWSTVNGNIVNGANTATPTVNSAGDYILTVTDNTNGCTDSDLVVVNQNANIPIADAGAGMTITCDMDVVNLNGNASSQGGNFSYIWTTSDGNIINGANTLTPTVGQAGQYCIEVTDNTNGCIAVDCTIVTEDNALPVISIADVDEINCLNNCVFLDATNSSQGANFTYQWTGPNIVNGANTLVAEVCAVGSYQLIITNSQNGCSASQTVVVAENTVSPTLNVNISGDLNCNNGSVTLSATSTATNSAYSWTGPNGFTSNIANPSVAIAGTYNLTVTDTDNGCTATIQALVNETLPPTATISSQTNVTCNGGNNGAATVAASGGTGSYTYQWSSGGMTDTETGLTAGVYTVTVTDGDLCTAIAMVNITEPNPLTANVTATGVSAAGADDGTATANPMGGTPGYTYLWNNNETGPMISGLAPGTYAVTVTDSNGCTATQNIVVNNFDCGGITLSFSVTNASCNGGNDGEITATMNGGIMPVMYMWSNGVMMATNSNLSAGTYAITAVDANNCEITGTATVTQPAAITVMTTSTNTTCNGGNDGTATATATGGTGNLTYAWSNGMTGATITDLTAGTYSVIVTDENACTADAMVTVGEPTSISLIVTTTDETANAANDGTATVSVSGGAGDYSFVWSNGATSQMIADLSPGEYCVVVTDADGCTAESCGMVMMFGCSNIQTVVSVTDVSCFGGMDGTATVISSNGTEPYTYEWSNGMTGAMVSGLAAGSYTVTCTDATDCSAEIEVTIIEPTELMLEVLNLGNVFCEGNSDGFISVAATGGVLGYSYLWNTGDTATTITDLSPGLYSVSVTNANNCTAVLNTEVALIPDTEMPVVVLNDLEVFLDANGMVSITPEMVDGGSTDNCGIESIVLDISDFDCADIGINPVMVAVLDVSGLCNFDTAYVTVVDSIAPVLTCPADIVMQGCNVVVNYDLPTATDNCGTEDPFLMDGIPSGGVFPSGTTVLQWGVNDLFGNPAICSFNVTVESDLTVNASSTNATCAGFSDGTATIELVNGVEPITYIWNDPSMQDTQTATNLAAGTYTATATDATGCSTVVSIVVEEPALIEIDIIEVIPEVNENMDGAITIEVNGGTGNPFSYEWFLDGNLFSTEPNLTGLSGGTYVVFVTDMSNCTNSDTIFVDMFVSSFESLEEEQVVLSPNPTMGAFQLDFQLGSEKEVNVSVFDITGKEMLNSSRKSITEDNWTFDLSQHPEGVYLVKIKIGEDFLVKRIILQK